MPHPFPNVLTGQALFVATESGFLPSLICKVANTASATPVMARLVFDSGAANSFLTSELVQRADLTENHRRYETVTGIGGKNSKLLIQYISCYLISCVDGTVHFANMRAIDQICSKLPPLDVD